MAGLENEQAHLFKDKEKRFGISEKVFDLTQDVITTHCSIVIDSENEGEFWNDIADRCDEISALIREEFPSK